MVIEIESQKSYIIQRRACEWSFASRNAQNEVRERMPEQDFAKETSASLSSSANQSSPLPSSPLLIGPPGLRKYVSQHRIPFPHPIREVREKGRDVSIAVEA